MSIQVLSHSLDRMQHSHDSQYDSNIVLATTSPVNAWPDPFQSSFVDSPALSTLTSLAGDCTETKKKFTIEDLSLKCMFMNIWFYFNPAETCYKYKKCDLFPATGIGNTQHKFDHTTCCLQNHNDSAKHQSAAKEYEGM